MSNYSLRIQNLVKKYLPKEVGECKLQIPFYSKDFKEFYCVISKFRDHTFDTFERIPEDLFHEMFYMWKEDANVWYIIPDVISEGKLTQVNISKEN